jgi:hypothetical protein
LAQDVSRAFTYKGRRTVVLHLGTTTLRAKACSPTGW